MDIYYILFICCFLVLPLDLVRIGWPRTVIYIIVCLLLIAIPGLRALGIDNDSGNYDEIFHVSQTLSFSEIARGAYWQNTERGFMALNKLVSLYSGAVTAVFLVCAVATGYLNYRFIYKNARLPFFALLMYVACFSFTMI